MTRRLDPSERKQTIGQRSAEIAAANSFDNDTPAELPGSPAQASDLDKAAPPAGVQVKTRVVQDWTNLTPPQTVPGGNYQQGQNGGRANVSPDSLTEFLEAYNDGAFYAMQVTREADPMLMRPPNPTFARPQYVNLLLGSIPFNRVTFIEDLQAINRNSGGSFSVQLFDDQNEYVDTWRGNIGDPIGVNTAPLATAPGSTDFEKPKTLIEALREQAEMTTLMRTITGAKTEDGLSDQDRVMKSLFGHPEIISATIGTFTTAIRAAAEAAASSGAPKPEGVREMALQAIFSDKTLQDKLVNTGMRALDVLGDLVAPNRTRKNPKPGYDATGEVIEEETAGDDEGQAPDTDPEIIVLEFMANECAEGRTVTIDHKIFAAYKEDEPSRYALLTIGLKSMAPQAIVDFICKRADTYGQGAKARLIWNRPAALAWIETLKASLK